jgi:CRISPR/Cas system endoribonuclease Cas6 (RAMP superfamily)
MATNMETSEAAPFLDILQCVAGKFPVKYLGLPLHFSKLKREDLQPLVDSLLSRMAGWRGELLSMEARRILI